MVLWQRVLMLVGFFVGILVIIPHFVELLISPTWGPVVRWGTLLLGSAWFVQAIISRWYPALKQRLGLTRVFKVLVGLNALAWLPGYCVARYVLNSVTGVDAGNFPTALWVFTLGGIAYIWFLLIILWLFLMSLKAFVMIGLLWVWGEVRTLLWDLPQARQFKRSLPIGRNFRDLFATFCVMALVGIGVNHPIMERTVDAVANLVLVGTEFSHDRTCAASSATRWVAPLKDRKEFKSSNVLVATYHTWNNISFKIEQCDDTTKPGQNVLSWGVNEPKAENKSKQEDPGMITLALAWILWSQNITYEGRQDVCRPFMLSVAPIEQYTTPTTHRPITFPTREACWVQMVKDDKRLQVWTVQQNARNKAQNPELYVRGEVWYFCEEGDGRPPGKADW